MKNRRKRNTCINKIHIRPIDDNEFLYKQVSLASVERSRREVKRGKTWTHQKWGQLGIIFQGFYGARTCSEGNRVDLRLIEQYLRVRKA